jgi:hypothetical protein
MTNTTGMKENSPEIPMPDGPKNNKPAMQADRFNPIDALRSE